MATADRFPQYDPSATDGFIDYLSSGGPVVNSDPFVPDASRAPGLYDMAPTVVYPILRQPYNVQDLVAYLTTAAERQKQKDPALAEADQLIDSAFRGDLNPLNLNLNLNAGMPDVDWNRAITSAAKITAGAAINRNHMTRQFQPFWELIERRMMQDPDWEFMRYIIDPKYGQAQS